MDAEVVWIGGIDFEEQPHLQYGTIVPCWGVMINIINFGRMQKHQFTTKSLFAFEKDYLYNCLLLLVR